MNNTEYRDSINSNENSYCSWTNYFFRAIQRLYPTKIFKFINFGARGTTPGWANQYLSEMLIKNNYQLTSNDLILIDYSINDAALELTQDLELELENLIRKLLIKSNFAQIVILETFPYPKCCGLRQDPQIVRNDYVYYYRKVAKYYQLPIWSYRNAVWIRSDNTEAMSHLGPYMDYIKFDQQHPPWYIHLFAADVYAAAFQHLHKKCALNIHNPSEIVTTLMPPMNKGVETSKCSVSDENLIISANAQHSDIIPIEKVDRSTYSTWRLYEDRKGKPGWIYDYDPASTFIDDASPWRLESINNSNYLNFPFKNGSFNYNEWRVQAPQLTVGYLKTYEHGGNFNVYICGYLVYSRMPGGNIDTLWKDFENEKVSLPYIFSGFCNDGHTAACADNPDKHFVTIVPLRVLNRPLNSMTIRKIKILFLKLC
jgi:hypothetical protein